MGIVTFKYDRSLADAFLGFPFDLYKDDAGWIPTAKKEMRRQMALSFIYNSDIRNDHLHILARNGRKVLGRATAFLNHPLNKGNEQVGAIGFFESINDHHVTEELLGCAYSWLHKEHGVKKVLAPMNFDIWHGYRCMTKGFDHAPFLGEPYNKPYYAALFEDFGFNVHKKWHSFDFPITDDRNFLLPGSHKAYDHCLSMGYTFKPFNPKKFESELRILYTLICDSYKKFSAYTPIDWVEFHNLYGILKHILTPECLTFVRDRTGKPIGFTMIIPEIGNMLRFLRRPILTVSKWLTGNLPYRNKKPLLYLIGIIQKEQLTNKGIGKALYYHTIKTMSQLGYSAFTVAMIAEGSPQYKHAILQSEKTISEYLLFERRL